MNIIVTGASRGIGYETARILAQKGHSIVATARSKDSLEELKKTNPAKIDIFPADLTKEEDVNGLAAHVERVFDNLDGLLNNAGGLIKKPFSDLEISDWESLMNVNLYSAVRLVKTFLPYFNSPAHILNISSMGGFQGSQKFPGLSAYSVSKGALCILTECLATELSEHDIHVNAFCLGAVQTEMLEEAFPGFQAPISADEMGEYIAEFLTKESKFYNGKILPVALSDPE